MTKRKVSQLFAVVVVGISAPAAAGNDPSEPMAPRTLPSGAPACGNAQVKSPRPCRTTVATPAPRPPAPAPVVAIPRTLPSGAPACGNVLAKLDGNQNSVAYQNCLKGIDPTEYVRQAMVIHKLLVAVGLKQPASWQVAKPREYKTGSPACGNVATRSGPSSRSRDCE